MQIAKSVFCFLLVGFCEIAGGYLVWLWIRENKPIWYALAGAVVLIIYGVVPTRCNRITSGVCTRPMVDGLSSLRFYGAGGLMALSQISLT